MVVLGAKKSRKKVCGLYFHHATNCYECGMWREREKEPRLNNEHFNIYVFKYHFDISYNHIFSKNLTFFIIFILFSSVNHFQKKFMLISFFKNFNNLNIDQKFSY